MRVIEGGINKRQHPTRVISITSGKGGVGKTNITTNLAIGLAQLGKSVLVFDADLNLANIDVLLGLKPRFTIHDLFAGKAELEQIMLEGPQGISIIPAGSALEQPLTLNTNQYLHFNSAIEAISVRFDYMLIDTQAGIGHDAMYFNGAASEVICVLNPEPTSLTDAYALIKLLAQGYGEREVSIISNRVSGDREGRNLFDRLQGTVERFLQMQLKYRGCVPSDPRLPESVQQQRAVLDLYPSSPAARAFAGLARTLDQEFSVRKVKGGMQLFFRQLLEISNGL